MPTKKPLFACVGCGCILPGWHDREGVCHHCTETKPGYEFCEEMYSQEALDFQEEVRLRAIWNEIIVDARNGKDDESFRLFKAAMRHDN